MSHRNRRMSIGAAAAVLAMAVATACTPSTPAPSFPCHHTDAVAVSTPVPPSGVIPPSLPPGIDFSLVDGSQGQYVAVWGDGFPSIATPYAEQTSGDGSLHVWVVAEKREIGLTFVPVRLHVYERASSSSAAPVEVYVSYAYDGLFVPSLGDGKGYPVSASIDSVAADGTGFVLAVDYSQKLPFLEGSILPGAAKSISFPVTCEVGAAT